MSLKLLSLPLSSLPTTFSTWYFPTILVLLLILPVCSYSRNADLVLVEAKLSLDVLLLLGNPGLQQSWVHSLLQYLAGLGLGLPFPYFNNMEMLVELLIRCADL